MGYFPPAGGSGLPTTGGTMTGTITSTLGSISSASKPFFAGTATFNDAAVTFEAFKINVTNTASASGSTLFDVQLAGTSKMMIDRAGQVGVGAAPSAPLTVIGVIESGNSNNATPSEIKVWQTSNTNSVSLKSSTAVYGSFGSGASGLFRSNTNFFVFYDLASGHTVINNSYSTSSKIIFASLGTTKVSMDNSGTFLWTDVGLSRNANGVFEINNGTVGTFRDLKARSVFLEASTTSQASLRIAHGTAPTSPVDGDMWTTTAGLYVRINGATVGPLS